MNSEKTKSCNFQIQIYWIAYLLTKFFLVFYRNVFINLAIIIINLKMFLLLFKEKDNFWINLQGV
jgi:hypothetical protein